MIGQTIGHYLVTEQIGAGGMGIVYRARDQRLNRDVALKVIPPEKFGDDAPRKRFRKEALALAKLNHPNIGTVYDFDTEGDIDFLVMEFIQGETLGQRIAKGPLPEKEWIAISLQIAAALEEAHEHGIVHQDLKPGNIMVTPKGQAKVLDFGLARLLDAEGAGEVTATLTQTEGAGTLPYMAPGQLCGEPVDSRSDIFSAGVVLYEMISGERLWALRGDVDVLRDLLNGQVPNVSFDRFPSVSPDVARVVARALAAKPDDRYPTALQMRQDLVKCMDALATPVSIDDISERMTTIFAKERSETALLIERRLGEIERDGQSGDVLRTAMVAAGPPRIPDRTPSGGTYWSGRTSEGVESASDARDARSDVRASSSSRRRAVVFAIGAASAFCALVAAIVVSLQHSGGYPEERAFTATAASAHGTETGSAGGDPAPQELSVDKSRAPDPPAPSEAAASVESAPLRAAASPRPLVDAGKPGVRPSSATTSHAAPSPVIDPLGDRK